MGAHRGVYAVGHRAPSVPGVEELRAAHTTVLTMREPRESVG